MSEPPHRSSDARWSRAGRVSLACYTLAGTASVVMGLLYLLSPRFQPYHREAVGAGWEQLDPGMRAVLGALLDVGGGGWLATGIAVLALAWVPLRRGERWAVVTTPVVGLAVWLPTTWATIEVTRSTPATAPWYGSGAAVALLVVGVVGSVVHGTTSTAPAPAQPGPVSGGAGRR